ncbi:MAG: energy transducer TonB [Acidobacteria bacterium]|nr:energy transducer TonB [Acidobacteriota bacterium]
MFEDSLFESAGLTGIRRTNHPITVAISFLLQCIVVGIMVLIPLVYTEALPHRHIIRFSTAPPPPSAARPAATASPPVRVLTQLARQQRELVQPRVIPEHAQIIHEELLPPIISGVVDDHLDILGRTPAILVSEVVPPAPPPPPPETTLRRIPVGGVVMTAKLTYQPKPIYPELARRIRVQGTVRLQAIISQDGSIENLTVLSGHPLLIPAALDAVGQWRYQPTLLNGQPVEVETTIDVNFTLGG